MGAGQSSNSSELPAIKTSYYTLLNVNHDASEEEIKRAYRRKALELHPDRNYGREEEATKLFADIQAAYEVLSDSQERAWYDSHEGAILRGFEDGDDGGGPGEGFKYGDIPITTCEDVNKVMAGVAGRKLSSGQMTANFFADLRAFFDRLAREEARAARMEDGLEKEYPTFGDQDDEYDDVAKPFYAVWAGFSTSKSYFWVDKWNLTEASDRRVRRAMEKENKKTREDAVREFNDSIRMLVAVVRKRDPRCLLNFQTDADRIKAARDAAQAQAAKSRAEHARKIEIQMQGEAVPDWAKVQHDGEDQPRFEDGTEETDEGDVEETFIECVACHKTFKSERQYEAHEKSKKHQKAISSLKKRMQKESEILDLESDGDDDGSVSMLENDHQSANATETGFPAEQESADMPHALSCLSISSPRSATHEPLSTQPPAANSRPSSSASWTRSETSNCPQDVQTRTPRGSSPSAPSSPSPLAPDLDTCPAPTLQSSSLALPATSKLGKAAQKRAKKAARAATTGDTLNARATCAVCDAAFPSRTRLFQHIGDLGHAAPTDTTRRGHKVKRK